MKVTKFERFFTSLSFLIVVGFVSTAANSANAAIRGYQVPLSISIVAFSILILATVIHSKK